MRGAPAPSPVRLRADQVFRTIAMVVDDLGLSFESTAQVRSAPVRSGPNGCSSDIARSIDFELVK